MSPDEFKRHNTVRQLKKCLAYLQTARRQLYFAEDRVELVRSYSSNCRDIFANLQTLRAGIEDTKNIISAEVQNIRHTMESPREQPPPIKGANLNVRLSPRQREMERTGKVKFPTTLPRTDTSGTVTDSTVPTIIPHTPYTPRKNKPNTRKKEGKIAI